MIDSPRRDLFATEVVTFLPWDDHPGFHAEEQRKVLALWQQPTERIDHTAVVRIVQCAGEPFLHGLQGQLFSRGFHSAKQERARPAVEAELERRLVVDHEQAAPRSTAEFLQFRIEVQPCLGGRGAETAGVAHSDHHGPTV
ncbi:hypothetical protein AB0I94_32595 [Streptomyces sp. NPDC050147]|uniref:hypothetical protein n=1 Tax=Streptomyces sp. NPDC050147 TaxID=3155513 RepID=UPI0034390CB8